MLSSPVRILFVEDEPAHIKLVQRAFREEADRMLLSVASSLKEARQHLKAESFDLVIADYRLPDGEGLELIPEKSSASIYPVIILTSQGNETVAVDAIKKGALDYVVKSEHVFVDMPRIAERTLREWQHIVEKNRTQQLLECIVESLPVQVVVVDSTGIILLANSLYQRVESCQLFEDADSILGKNFIEYLKRCGDKKQFTIEGILDQIVKGCQSVLSGSDSPFEQEFQFGYLKAQYSWLIRVVPLSEMGNARAIVTISNITERKLIENQNIEQAVVQAQLEMLSPREKEVLLHVSTGDSNKVVASKLNLSERTVEKHRASAMKKLNVRSLADLVRLVVSSEPPS